MRLKAAVLLALLAAAPAAGDDFGFVIPAVQARVPIEDLFRRFFGLQRALASQGLDIRMVHVGIGYYDRVTFYLNPDALRNLPPIAQRGKLAGLLEEYAKTAEDIRAYYHDTDFLETLDEVGRAVLARAIIKRIGQPSPDYAERTIVIDYYACRRPDNTYYKDLPVCSDGLLKIKEGKLSDPQDPPPPYDD